MSKAWIFSRPSGLYVRVRVPSHLRGALGQRFIVRALRCRGDAARLAAAALGYSLAQAFREHDMANPDDLRRRLRKFEIKGTPGLPDFSVRTDGSEQDNNAAVAFVRAMAGTGGRVEEPGEGPRGLTVGEARDLFLTQFQQQKHVASTLQETIATLDLFVESVGAWKPLARLTVEDCDAWRNVLARWPTRAKVIPKWRGLSTGQIMRAVQQEAPEHVIGDRTKDKHFDNVRKFFGWAVQRGNMARNFLSGVRIQTKEQRAEQTRREFTPEELRTLFAPELRAEWCTTPERWWLPVLALYTGARLREMAQLRVVDVRDVAGFWGIDINPGAGPLKNAGSKRFVPLAAPVLAAGFLAYLDEVKAAGFARLFPGGSWTAKNGPGDKISRWWNIHYMKAAGIDDREAVFHSFRHTFATAADGVGLTIAQTGRLTGHQPQSVLSKHYIHARSVPERKRQVDEIAATFAVEVGHYTPGMFANAWADLARETRHAEAVARRKKRQGRAPDSVAH